MKIKNGFIICFLITVAVLSNKIVSGHFFIEKQLLSQFTYDSSNSTCKARLSLGIETHDEFDVSLAWNSSVVITLTSRISNQTNEMFNVVIDLNTAASRNPYYSKLIITNVKNGDVNSTTILINCNVPSVRLPIYKHSEFTSMNTIDVVIEGSPNVQYSVDPMATLVSCINFLQPTPTYGFPFYSGGSTTFYKFSLILKSGQSCNFFNPIQVPVSSANYLGVIEVPAPAQSGSPPLQIQSIRGTAPNGTYVVLQTPTILNYGYYFDIGELNSNFFLNSSGNIYPILGSPQKCTYFLQFIFKSKASMNYALYILNQGLVNDPNYINQINYKDYPVKVTIEGSLDYIADLSENYTDIGYLTWRVNNLDKDDIYINNIKRPFPHSVQYGTFNNFTLISYLVYYNCQVSKYFSYQIDGVSSSNNIIGGYENCPPLAILSSIEIIPFSFDSVIVRLNVSNDAGVLRIVLNNPSDIINQRNLVAGNHRNGIYEKEVFLNRNGGSILSLDVVDYSERSNRYYSYDILNTMQVVPTIPFPITWTVDNITEYYFKENNQDVTNLIVSNTLYFNVENPLTNFRPRLTIINSKLPSRKDSVFEGYWNPYISKYQIDFQLQRNLFQGPISYSIQSYPDIPSSLIISKFSSATLNIKSKNADLQPPFITNLVSKKYKSGDYYYIGWDVTIEDSPNGLRYAYFNVTSDMDWKPYQFIFAPENATTGDMSIGVYSIRIQLDQTLCINQTFSFKDSVMLIDTEGNIAQSYYSNFKSPFDPMERILYSPIASNISINVADICNINTNIDIPSVDIGFPSNIDVSTPNNTFLTNIKINASMGLSVRHKPIIVFTSLGGDTFTAEFNVDKLESHPTFNIPYGFGSADIIINVQVYGIIGSNLRIGSRYNTVSFGSNRKFYFTKIPYLESYKPISRDGGLLTVMGREFGNDQLSLYATIVGDSQRKEIVFSSYTRMMFNVPAFGNNKYIDIFVNSTSAGSNLLRIIPSDIPSAQPPSTPTPTPTQTTCPGSPQCSSNGKCNQGKCECNSGWIGPSCSLKLIDVITNVDPNKPTTTISGKDNLLNSFIQIASLYELDQNKNIIQQYDLKDKWSFENQTTPDSTIYIFSRLLSSDRTTRINITLQYFDKDSIYSFGNQNFTMNKSSMKYSIILGSYQFGNQLNTLQLVMNATLSTKDSNGCIRSDFSSDSDVEYLKVQINENTLFARFINFGIFDFRVKSLTNQILNKTSESRGSISTSLIGINIPYYEMSALLDPDFSVLVDQNADVCSSKSGLTTAQIIGIAVGGAVFLIFASIIIILLIKRRYSFHFKKGINMVKLDATTKKN